ncbi:endonuclease-reverse transcriptase [Elysia marginata]|uniref:Endonuclease-reverse transcriptase n=1 Tax=Elysia marginata TaxID=1093978 RepID=A0AAV4JBK7_9GAST|nr:endonuclease-reverse transcriptase [Elysia marginata]
MAADPGGDREEIYTNALWRPRIEQSGNPFLVNPWKRDGTESKKFFFRETSKYHGLNIGGRKFNNIRYADDAVLLTENAEDLQLLAEAVNKHSNDADTWTLPQSKLKKIETFEMWTYRRLAKISWKDKKTNQEVCEHLGTRRELVNTIKTRKIKHFGHIKRHASFLRDVLEGKIEGSRPRGRQRRDIHQCTVEAQDRAKRKSVSCQPLEQGRHREFFISRRGVLDEFKGFWDCEKTFSLLHGYTSDRCIEGFVKTQSQAIVDVRPEVWGVKKEDTTLDE